MADESHDICDLVGCDDTASFTLATDLWRHVMLIGFEDGGLMKTNCGSVDIHVDEDDVRVRYTSRQS